MESHFIGLIIGLVVLKIVLITIYCYFRTKRLNAIPRVVVVDAARIRQRNQRNDGVAIVGQAEPMGTSPPPNPPAKQAPRPPSYEQATDGPNPYRQDPSTRDRPRPYPQDPNARGPYSHGPNAHGPYSHDPNARGPYSQDPNARDRPRQYPQDPNARGPCSQDQNDRRPYPQDQNGHVPKF